MRYKNKNIKKATIHKIKEEYVSTIVECPHCHTRFRGFYDKNILLVKCKTCKNAIELDWDE